MTTTLVALYDDATMAQRAVADLIDHGIDRNNAGLIGRKVDTRYANHYFNRDYQYDSESQYASSVAGELIQLGVPQSDAHAYGEGVRRGGVLAMALVPEEHVDEGVRILERHHPINVRERTTTWRNEGWTGYQADTERRTPTRDVNRGEDEAVIDVVEEDVKVGKRATQQGAVRVHKYVREVPVEKTVTLRQSYVDIDRRPVDRPATEADFNEETFEVTEEGEEAVVAKEARVTEQVRVHKDTTEERKTVRDTERHTEVEVERDGGRSRR